MNPTVSERRLIVDHSNIGLEKADSLGNGPLRLVMEKNNALSSFRNGPVKASNPLRPGEPKRDISPLVKERPSQVTKPPLQKKPRVGKYARPASPGIHGKVAEPSYKNVIKNYPVVNKGKTGPSPRQQVTSGVKPNPNAITKGLSPGRAKWKS